MTNRKISEFTALTAPAGTDVLPIIDQSGTAAEKNKKITYANLLSKAPDGSASAPAFSFNSDNNSGISGGSDTLTFSTAGVGRLTISSAGLVTIPGDLTVAGTTTTIDSTTLTVKDKNIEIAKGNGNDAAVDGAGITVDSTDGDKTWNWVDSTDAWTSSEHIDLASGKVLKVAGTQVLSATDFTGTSSVATNVTVADESSDTTCNVLFVTAETGNLPPKTGTNLTFNSSSGALTATSFVGDLTGDVTGNVTGNTSGSSGSCTGNSATATEATNLTVSANNSTDETVYPLFVDGATGTQGAETDTGLTYNPSSGLLTSTSFAGALTGNVTGNVTGNTSGSSGSCTGNAATATALATARTIGGTSFDGTANIAVALASTATALETARTIGGVSFDGTANINLPGVNAAGNQDTTGNAATATALETARTINGTSFDGSANITVTAAGSTLTGTTLKSTIVGSSLTSVGTLTGLTVSGDILMSGTGAIDVATGTTAQRPGSPNTGMFRYNSTTNQFEGYTNAGWGAIAGGGGSATLQATNGIVETAATISSNHTISTNYNAMSAGPVTVSADITIPSGSVWTIV